MVHTNLLTVELIQVEAITKKSQTIAEAILLSLYYFHGEAIF